jgi:hypothetical protein
MFNNLTIPEWKIPFLGGKHFMFHVQLIHGKNSSLLINFFAKITADKQNSGNRITRYSKTVKNCKEYSACICVCSQSAKGTMSILLKTDGWPFCHYCFAAYKWLVPTLAILAPTIISLSSIHQPLAFINFINIPLHDLF